MEIFPACPLRPALPPFAPHQPSPSPPPSPAHRQSPLTLLPLLLCPSNYGVSPSALIRAPTLMDCPLHTDQQQHTPGLQCLVLQLCL